MANCVTIQPTKFYDVRTGDEHLGFRIYDDYASAYCNTWENISDDDMAVIEQVFNDDNDIIQSMVDYIREEQLGIFVGDDFYEWEEIKHLV